MLEIICEMVGSKLQEKNKLEIELSGIPALSSFQNSVSNYSQEYKTYITQEMLKLGYLAANACYLSIAHEKNQVIDLYLEHINIIFEKIKKLEGRRNNRSIFRIPIMSFRFSTRLN